MSLTNEQIVTISGKIKVLQSERDDIDEAIENLKSKLAENLPEDKHLIGDYVINVYTGARYDEAYGKKKFPELWEEFAEEKKALPSALAKAKLTPEQYEAFQKPNSKTTVVVELRED